jgi:hypothetical protein
MPNALSPQLEAAIEDFTNKKKEKAALIEELTAKAEIGGVKGKAAQNTLDQMEASDSTETNRLEATLNAAKRKALKSSGDQALKEAKERAAAKEAADKEAAKARLAAKSAMFNK